MSTMTQIWRNLPFRTSKKFNAEITVFDVRRMATEDAYEVIYSFNIYRIVKFSSAALQADPQGTLQRVETEMRQDEAKIRGQIPNTDFQPDMIFEVSL